MSARVRAGVGCLVALAYTIGLALREAARRLKETRR